MVQSKSVLSVSTEMKVGESGYENISIEFFGTSVHEYFDHLSWHLVDRKFAEKISPDVMTGSCEVPLVVDVARPTERSLFGETTQFVYRALDQSPVDRPFSLSTLHEKVFYTRIFNFV